MGANRDQRHIALLTLATVLWSTPAAADITPAQYRDVGVSVESGAGVPRDAMVTGEDGKPQSLAGLISRPSVLVFADYDC